MKKIVQLGILVIAGALMALIVSPTINAQTAITPTMAQCSTAQTRLTDRIAKVEAVKTAQTKVYTDIQSKLDMLVTSASANGYDTAALVKAQQAMATKADTYAQKAAAYSAALLNAKNTPCSSTNSEFMTALTSARTALTATRTATTDVRSAFSGDVTKELQAYALSLKTDSTGGTK